MRNEDITQGNIYHIYNRGVDRQKIFFSARNMGFFLFRLRKYFDKENISLYAYCLISNHYHLLIKVEKQNFGLKVMQPFLTSYTKAINLQQDRVGPLFQGSFKGKLMPSVEIALYASKYIHLNPVKAKLVRHPVEWQYSSYKEYLIPTNKPFVKKDLILSFFKTPQAYESFVLNEEDGYHDSFED